MSIKDKIIRVFSFKNVHNVQCIYCDDNYTNNAIVGYKLQETGYWYCPKCQKETEMMLILNDKLVCPTCHTDIQYKNMKGN